MVDAEGAERVAGVFEAGAFVAEHAADDGREGAEDGHGEQFAVGQGERTLAVEVGEAAGGGGEGEAAGEQASALLLEAPGFGDHGQGEVAPVELAGGGPGGLGDGEAAGQAAAEGFEPEVVDIDLAAADADVGARLVDGDVGAGERVFGGAAAGDGGAEVGAGGVGPEVDDARGRGFRRGVEAVAG